MNLATTIPTIQSSNDVFPKTVDTATPPRTLLTVQLPPGTLKLVISDPEAQHQHSTNNSQHVWVAEVESDSPCLGTLVVGDWLLSINGVDVVGKGQKYCANVFRSTANAPRIVTISRGGGAATINTTAGIDKENAPGSKPAAVASKSSTAGGTKMIPTTMTTTVTADRQALLLTMTVEQLKNELHECGLSQSGHKNVLLERLGVPALQWMKWRQMKVSQLKDELKQRYAKVSGTKDELLQRLGVPVGFGETRQEKFNREHRENMKRRKEQHERLKKKLKSLINPEDDPTHEEYTKPCCKNPKFPAWNDHTIEPAGMIRFPDSSMMEVWRCLACGKIPQRPNAPPIEEFSDHESDNGDEEYYFTGRGGGGAPLNSSEDCIIQ